MNIALKDSGSLRNEAQLAQVEVSPGRGRNRCALV